MRTRSTRAHLAPRSRLALLIAFVLALTLVGAACSSSSKGAVSNADIVVHDFAFVTKPVTAGATVTVHSNGPSTHSVTSDDGTSFNISSIDSGKDATFTAPTKAGTYKFHCNFHTTMHGTLTVQ